MKPSGIITFLSDFGLSDWFTASVKGEILKIHKDARIIDVTHIIRPHDIQGTAFVVSQYFNTFPNGTVHLVVVDPGVGSSRRGIAVIAQKHTFIAPDNGVLTHILDKDAVVYELPVPDNASTTFHGRDVFGPAAARFSLNERAAFTKIKVSDCQRVESFTCTVQHDRIMGRVVYIDHFGNCITNIPVDHDVINFQYNQIDIPVRQCYAEGEENEIIGVRGSSGFYEIIVNKGNAQKLLKNNTGACITAHIR
jgi:S-adenosylmethionine hydrolase